jgi:prepilin-type processing-associated H-X9-DG protein
MYTHDNRDVFPRVQDISYGTVNPSYDPGVTLERTWVDLLAQRDYISAHLDTHGLPQSLLCPSATGWDNDPTWAGSMPHFGVNVNLSPPRRLDATLGQRSFSGKPFNYTGDQSRKIMMAESRHLTNLRGWFAIGNINWIAGRHGSSAGANTAYLDGHVALRLVETPANQEDPTYAFAGINFWRQSAR